MKNKKLLIFFYKNLNCLILKKKINSIYFFNRKYFFLFPYINIKNVYLNKNINILIIKELKNFSNKIKIIYNITEQLTENYYKKIIFNGKGFKLKKKSNKNFFFFNNSHIKLIVENKNLILKNSKNSFLVLYKNKFNLKLINYIKNLFKLNIFTKKGVKINRELMLIKKIKKK